MTAGSRILADDGGASSAPPATGRVAVRESLAAAAALAAVGFAVFGTYLVDGGFNDDDWVWLRDFRHPFDSHYQSALRDFVLSRPGAGAYLAPLYTLAPHQMRLHLGLTLVLYLAVPALFYVLLRMLSFARRDAGAMALLALLFPFSNTSAFWPTAGIISFSVGLFLAGLILSIRGLQRQSGRLRSLALLLWAGSFLTYEIAAAAMLVAGLLYLLVAERRRALYAWAIDVSVVVPLAVLEGLSKAYWSERSDVSLLSGGSAIGAHLKALATESFSMLAPVAFPFTTGTRALQRANNQNVLERPMGLWPLLALVVVGAAVVAARRVGRPAADELRTWLWTVLAAAGALAACYAVFLPASLFYTPLQQGIGNRTNALAALAWVVLLFALLRLAALVVVPRRRVGARGRELAVTAAVLAVAGGYAWRDRIDLAHWSQAYREETAALATIRRLVPSPPRGATFLVLLDRTEVAPGVRVWVGRSDLAGALGYYYDDDALQALPLERGVGRLACRDSTLGFVTESPDFRIPAAAYRRTVVVDVPAGERVPIAGTAACRRFAARSGLR